MFYKITLLIFILSLLTHFSAYEQSYDYYSNDPNDAYNYYFPPNYRRHYYPTHRHIKPKGYERMENKLRMPRPQAMPPSKYKPEVTPPGGRGNNYLQHHNY
jgi:hypothetical protein